MGLPFCDASYAEWHAGKFCEACGAVTVGLPTIMGMGDVTQYLKVSRQYVDRLVEQGKLHCKQTSTGKVFLFSDVDAFQKEREKKKSQKN